MVEARFVESLAAWLNRVNAVEQPPESVVAYNIGLLETPDGYSAYLMGADHFDPEDSDWACEETFTPQERYFAMSRADVGGDWHAAQSAVVAAAQSYLQSAAGKTSFLANAKAVTVGFDDGDLEQVAPK